MMHEIEDAATTTKNAVADARDQVADGSQRFERIARAAFRAIPLLPERTFEFVLDRMGLMHKTSGVVGTAAAFAGGFVAGSVTTALTTPMSGAMLRRKIARSIAAWSKEASDGVESVKDLANEAKTAVANGAAKVVRSEHAASAKVKRVVAGRPVKHRNGSTARAHRST